MRGVRLGKSAGIAGVNAISRLRGGEGPQSSRLRSARGVLAAECAVRSSIEVHRRAKAAADAAAATVVHRLPEGPCWRILTGGDAVATKERHGRAVRLEGLLEVAVRWASVSGVAIAAAEHSSAVRRVRPCICGSGASTAPAAPERSGGQDECQHGAALHSAQPRRTRAPRRPRLSPRKPAPRLCRSVPHPDRRVGFEGGARMAQQCAHGNAAKCGALVVPPRLEEAEVSPPVSRHFNTRAECKTRGSLCCARACGKIGFR